MDGKLQNRRGHAVGTRSAPELEDAVIMAMALMTRARHHETGRHIIRTQRYVHALARSLAGHPSFSISLNPEHVAVICKAAALHDVGDEEYGPLACMGKNYQYEKSGRQWFFCSKCEGRTYLEQKVESVHSAHAGSDTVQTEQAPEEIRVEVDVSA